jgi:omega-6 fatty acid desaturase (delta-12 desaturase)
MIRRPPALPGLPQMRRASAAILCRLLSRASGPPQEDDCATTPSADARGWRELAAPFAKPDGRRGALELLYTAAPFLLLVGAILYGVQQEIWGAVALVLPAAAFLVRLFIIQHDCGHGSYFRSRRANDYLGRIIGVFTLTPYAFWRQDHATHHATSGNLSRRGVGDITTLTVREYLSRPALRRLLYRLYRHPVVLFVIGPAYQFLLVHRLPRGHPLRSRTTWLSVLGTNAVLAAAGAGVVLLLGWRPLVIGYLPISLLAGSIGIWLFYVQHQFEDTYWRNAPQWDFQAAAFEGCSLYDLPAILHWLTGHIGFHHIHHLAIRIPSYRLRAAFDAVPAFRQARRLRLRESFGCAKLALWDERRGRLVRFADIGA